MENLPTPFHTGELAIQEKMGVREQVHAYAPRFVRSYLPEQHSELLETLPFILVGSIDSDNQPTASILFGFPGFISASSETTVSFEAHAVPGDPLADNMQINAPLGFLAIEFDTRRRNRMNGKVASVGKEAFSISLDQTFGNCPQYIQSRTFDYEAYDPRSILNVEVSENPDAARVKDQIETADTFFIASSHFEDEDDIKHGVDVSHRGGKPGFVKVENGVITFPDFSGNNHFNTIGNIVLNPKVGLLFPDFETGDLLQIEGEAHIIWEGPEVLAIEGAQRLVTVIITKSRRIANAIPANWHFHDYSPSLQTTGSYVDGQTTADVSDWRTLRLERIERESDVINSFYFTPTDGEPTRSYVAGQHLPLRHPSKPKAMRTYTLSRAPSGDEYRISVKREPEGEVSRLFHGKLRVGDKIEAKAPAGQFHLGPKFDKPVLLVSAGVGITPMIAMLEDLVNKHGCSKGKGCPHPIVFIHTAKNGEAHAFRTHPILRSAEDHGVTKFVTYTDATTLDIVEKSFNARGRVTQDQLASLLPDLNADVFLCGPAGFMQSMRDHFNELGVPDGQIRQELFGPASQPKTESIDADIPVKLSVSNSDLVWNPSKSSLLEAIEDAGVDAPFSCRSGSCGTCLTKVLQGKLDHPTGTAFETDEGEALICCAMPLSSSETITEELVLEL